MVRGPGPRVRARYRQRARRRSTFRRRDDVITAIYGQGTSKRTSGRFTISRSVRTFKNVSGETRQPEKKTKKKMYPRQYADDGRAAHVLII